MGISKTKKVRFQKIILDHYKKYGRGDLPWRSDSRGATQSKKINPYEIWVSEIMLQQTQVDRVISFFNQWMKTFPTVKKLANASQTDILKIWKGLGYNSRALRMKKSAQIITQQYGGKFPKTYDELLKLPGVGPYTAGAICAFAYDQSVVMIETNIRRVYLHYFFTAGGGVHDKEIIELIGQTLPNKDFRNWYWALMDYGSHLGKISKENPNKKSRHYTRQSKFVGSDRQIRGKILEILLSKKRHRISFAKLFSELKNLSDDRDRIEVVVDQMERDGFLGVIKNNIVLKK